MEAVAQSNESNLDLAERIHELLDDISLGVSQENMSADDIVEYIEEYIEHELPEIRIEIGAEFKKMFHERSDVN